MRNNAHLETVGERIRFVRGICIENQSQMADKLGVNRAHISKIETNKAKPSSRLIKTLCIIYGLREEWVLYGTLPMSELEQNNSFEEVFIRKEVIPDWLNLTWSCILEMVLSINSDARKLRNNYMKSWNEAELKKVLGPASKDYPDWLYPESVASIIAYGRDLLNSDTRRGIPVPEKTKAQRRLWLDPVREAKYLLSEALAFLDGVESRLSDDKKKK